MKLDAIRHDMETRVIGAADASVISLHWQLDPTRQQSCHWAKGHYCCIRWEEQGDIDAGPARKRGGEKTFLHVWAARSGRRACPSQESFPSCAQRRWMAWLVVRGWGRCAPIDGRSQCVNAPGRRGLVAGDDTPREADGARQKRSGAKRSARMCWSVWMIQRM